ncbi:SET domain-containing protein [Cadophora sp. DSE1049]|nr:SET domain-containing protein [Cadophora sp. DSE1049]
MADKTTTSADTVAGQEPDKMFPMLTVESGSLADDFDKWMEVRMLWSWYKKSSRRTIITNKVKKAGGEGSHEKPSEPPAPRISEERHQYLHNYIPPSPTPSSSNSSILSGISDSTPPTSASPSLATSFSATFCASTQPQLPSLLSPNSPSDITPTIIQPPSNTQALFSSEYFEVRRSKKGGYGAFATKDIETETIIMVEKPLFRANFMEVFVELEKLTREQRREYRTLHGYTGLSPTKDLAIYKTNRFETSGGKGGIFIKSSRFNHACHPFATCSYRYDEAAEMIVFTACNPIKKDQEITISYTTNPCQLMDNYGFYCDCPKCPPPRVAKKQAKVLRGPW